MSRIRCSRPIISALIVMALLVSSTVLSPLHRADASSLTGLSDSMSTLKKGVASSHIIRSVTPTGIADAADTIIITFPADFNFTDKTISTVTFTHGAVTGTETTETLASSPSGTAWGAAFSGTANRVLTLTAPSDGTGSAVVAPGEKLVISYDSTSALNPLTAGTYIITMTGTFGDIGNVSVQILDDDQVLVSATVNQTLTFSISDNSIGFGTLSSGAARYATADELGSDTETEAHSLVAATNAASGYTTTVKGATLTYGTSTIDAIGASNAASAVGTEQFGIRLTALEGAGTVSAPYADSGFAYSATDTTTSQVGSSSTSSAPTTYSVRYLANISTGTDAGIYQATLTYVTTANF